VKKIRATLSFENAMSKKSFPLTKSDLMNLLNFLNEALHGEPEWGETRDVLGFDWNKLGVHLCDDEKMRELYLQFKGTRRTTDVLSFASRDSVLGVEPGYLGDIVVSMESVSRNAKRLRKTLFLECETVLLHSFLHLLGFEHVGVSHKKAKRMQSMQKRLLLLWKKR